MSTRRSLIGALIGAAALYLAPQHARAQDWVIQEIYAAGARYGVSGDWLLRVAICESELNPAAVGRNGEIGLFQFMPSTWYAWGGGDIWSVWEQADLAAWAFSAGLSHHWVCQ